MALNHVEWFKTSPRSVGQALSTLNSTLTIYLWTKCTDNRARQTLVSGQVASLHVLQKSCGHSRARFEENVTIFVQKSDRLYRNICYDSDFPVKTVKFSCKNW